MSFAEFPKGRMLPSRSPRGWREWGSVSAALGLAIAAGLTVSAKDFTPEERANAIKAGWLYNFVLYTAWPSKPNDPPDAPLLIGVVGKESFRELSTSALQGRRVENSTGRRIEVREVDELSNLGQFHCVFISASEEARVRQVLDQTVQSAVLTVGETPSFYREGGIIRIVRDLNEFSFEVNPAAEKRAREAVGLTLSSKLLAKASNLKLKR